MSKTAYSYFALNPAFFLGGGITPVDAIGLGLAHVLVYLSHLPIIPVEGNGAGSKPAPYGS